MVADCQPVDGLSKLGNVEREGRSAFVTHGVAGERRHDYLLGCAERNAFLRGYWAERFAAADRARLEGRAFQARSACTA